MKFRSATSEDLQALIALGKHCQQKDELQLSEEAIRRLIICSPESQIIVEVENTIVGVVHSQRIRDVEELVNLGFAHSASCFHAQGEYVYLLQINVRSAIDKG